MNERPCYELLATDIRDMGVERVFGLMSDDTARFVATLDAIGVKFHSARHENNACAMAEGYASASGKLGCQLRADVVVGAKKLLLSSQRSDKHDQWSVQRCLDDSLAFADCLHWPLVALDRLASACECAG